MSTEMTSGTTPRDLDLIFAGLETPRPARQRRTILIVDVETSGLDPEADELVEIGAVWYDLEAAAPLATYASLVRASANAAAEINGIPAELLPSAPSRRDALAVLEPMVAQSWAIVAHNAAFDRSWMTEWQAHRWICTLEDVKWPRGGGRLSDLALRHGVGMVRAHRAIEDCLTLADVCTRVAQMGVDLVQLFEQATEPKVLARALVSYDDRELAKEAGFRWVPERRAWIRRMRESELAALPFRAVVLEREGVQHGDA